MSACLITDRAAAPCRTCGVYQMDRIHIVGETFYCAACCPSCRPVENKWDEATPAGTVTGEQGGLF